MLQSAWIIKGDKMKYTNKQLQEYFEILNNIASKVTGKLAYLVIKNAHKISNELQEYTTIRNQKIQEYGEPFNDTIRLSVDSENYPKFISEMAEYDEIELELNFLKAEPEDLYTSNLNAIEMEQISFMINDEEDA